MKTLYRVLNAAKGVQLKVSTTIYFQDDSVEEANDTDLKLTLYAQGEETMLLDTGVLLKKGFPSSSVGRVRMLIPVPALG